MTDIIKMHVKVWVSDASLRLRKHQMKQHAAFDSRLWVSISVSFDGFDGWFKNKSISVSQLLGLGYVTVETGNPQWPFIIVNRSDVIFDSECPAVFVGQNGGTCRKLGCLNNTKTVV